MNPMLRRALRANLGLRHQLEKNLLGADGERWEAELKKFLRQETCWVKAETPQPAKPQLLAPINTLTIPALPEKFIASCLVHDGVHLWGNFREWFLAGEEEPQAEVTLAYASLTRNALDREIRQELGAEHEETTLAQINWLITHQSQGEPGPLLTDGRANIFYVKDAKGILRAVFVFRNACEWHLFARVVADPIRWYEGDRVFSRNSSFLVAA
ncbi:MAG: hypothetical protein HY220_04035 [Candidatus Sungbacteria bacterium]|uniref:Uncharacterized protein n=1 Tax=Candidatus Sungiibacteriota bacterium TaxID=2750080 RepID=A0A9D6QUE3_9BACT|nr:hypothetical protein [Candidatus Sungbacteria bacterium]